MVYIKMDNTHKDISEDDTSKAKKAKCSKKSVWWKNLNLKITKTI